MLTHAWFLRQWWAGNNGRAKADEGRAAAGRPPDGRAAAERPPGGRAAAERPPGGRAAAERPPGGRAAAERPPGGRAAAERPPGGRAAAERPPGGRAAAERPPEGRAAAERRAVSSVGERAATDEPAACRADEGTHSTGAVIEATASRTANLQDRRAIPPLRSTASLERDCSPRPGHRAALPRTLSGRAP